MSGVVVPAGLIDVVRDGLRGQISVVAAQLADAELETGTREHPERYREPLQAIDSLRALLERIGWDTPASDQRIDLDTHGWALVRSIDDRMDVLIDQLAEIDRQGPAGAEPRAVVVPQATELCKLAIATMTLLAEGSSAEPVRADG